MPIIAALGRSAENRQATVSLACDIDGGHASLLEGLVSEVAAEAFKRPAAAHSSIRLPRERGRTTFLALMAKEPDFLKTLETAVRAVLEDADTKASERIAAIAAGAKLLMIRHKINETDESSFFR